MLALAFPAALLCVLVLSAPVFGASIRLDDEGNFVMTPYAGKSCLCGSDDLLAAVTAAQSQARIDSTAISTLTRDLAAVSSVATVQQGMISGLAAQVSTLAWGLAPTGTSTGNGTTTATTTTAAPASTVYPWTVANNVTSSALARYTAIVGSLQLSGPGATSLFLPALTWLGGDLNLSNNTQMTLVSLPVLGAIGGSVIVEGGGNGFYAHVTTPFDTWLFTYTSSNTALTLITLPALTRTGGALSITNTGQGNAALTVVNLAALTYIGTYVYFENNPVLTLVNVPVLASVNGPSALNEYVNICRNAVFGNYANITKAAAGKSCLIGTNPCGAITCS